MTRFAFIGYRQQTGYEPYIYDSESNSVNLIADLVLGASSSITSPPATMVKFANKGLFVASDNISGSELWTTDGTVSGTYLIKDIAPGVRGGLNSTESPLLTIVKGYGFFVANTVQSGAELWRTDGTDIGTIQIADLNPGRVGSAPRSLQEFRDGVIFAADNIQGLFYATATSIIKFSEYSSYNVTVAKDQVFYYLNFNSSYELRVSDGALGADRLVFGPSSGLGINKIYQIYGTDRGGIFYC